MLGELSLGRLGEALGGDWGNPRARFPCSASLRCCIRTLQVNLVREKYWDIYKRYQTIYHKHQKKEKHNIKQDVFFLLMVRKASHAANFTVTQDVLKKTGSDRAARPYGIRAADPALQRPGRSLTAT